MCLAKDSEAIQEVGEPLLTSSDDQSLEWIRPLRIGRFGDSRDGKNAVSENNMAPTNERTTRLARQIKEEQQTATARELLYDATSQRLQGRPNCCETCQTVEGSGVCNMPRLKQVQEGGS